MESFKKKIWIGQFDIVLSNEKISNSSLNSSNLNNSLQNLAGIDLDMGINTNSLKTEVGILESQSILMPIFEFVNNEKIKMKSSTTYGVFEKWRANNLDVKLKKGTSILTIKYKDKDRDLIVPVLQKISEKYQEYSFRNKTKDIKLTKKFIDSQLKLYRLKSKKSANKAEQFAIENNLPILNASKVSNSLSASTRINSEFSSLVQIVPDGNVDIELVRIEASNQLIELKNQLKENPSY